ncbi:MAG: tRNA (guanosine(46)-N(7))-methyltransferase TrmB [Xanthobacteraceae bacterium]|uniref:tRNA (guanine(46)-N(7))-methyltransferase TrmB n=1 Tax=Pseudolabrys sp. TaxID=1960880 RepID=UPI003D1023D0
MLSMQTDAQNRIRAFFGRRKGHPLRRHQAGLFGTLLPRVAVDLDKPAPADLRTLFPAATVDCRLEIGFGGAEHLAAQAQAHPSTGFIGSDGFENAIAKALAYVEQHALANVRLHHGDAVHLLEWLPAASLARVDLLYPDPWPKRRHWKRRFVQDESLALIARTIRSGGEMRFATDIPDYAAWTLARILRSPDFEWTAETADDWRKPWGGFVRTRYEAKAIREGRTPAYFIFRRK